MNDTRALPSIGVWVLVLGVVGFCAGFFGPIALRPEANQGPLVGIFITGPGGAVLGLVLGLVFRFLPVSNARRAQALVATAAALGLGTLIYCLPPPDTQGTLLEATVQSCQSPADLTDAAIRDWEQRVANAPWAQVRPGWKQEVPAMLRGNTGVVLTLDVARRNRILRHRKPWNAGQVDAEGWQPAQGESKRYFAEFAGNDCAAYERDLPILYVRQGQGGNAWPPDELPNLLSLAVVEAAPFGYLEMVRRQGR